MNRLSREVIEKELKSLNGWNFESDMIGKKFEFKNFKESLAFIVRIGLEAEELNHHPNIFNVYNQVTIELQTHDAGNTVTQKDLQLAKAIESIL